MIIKLIKRSVVRRLEDRSALLKYGRVLTIGLNFAKVGLNKKPPSQFHNPNTNIRNTHMAKDLDDNAVRQSLVLLAKDLLKSGSQTAVELLNKSGLLALWLSSKDRPDESGFIDRFVEAEDISQADGFWQLCTDQKIILTEENKKKIFDLFLFKERWLKLGHGKSIFPPDAVTPPRRRLPDERQSITHKFSIARHEGYVTVGLFEDGTPGEIFITMSKEGSTVAGLVDSLATSVSIALQYGVPLKVLVDKFSHSRYEPSGFTNNPDVPIAKSVSDYIFRWLGKKFIKQESVPEIAAQGSSVEGGDHGKK